MKQNLALCLLAWWFFYGSYEPHMFGPFHNKRACESVKDKLKEWVPRHVNRPTSECFWDDSQQIYHPK